MREKRRFALLGVLFVLLVLATTISGAASGDDGDREGPDPAKVQKLRDEARGSVSISTKDATKHAGFVRAGQNGDLNPTASSDSPQAKANDFVQEFKDVLGSEGESQLVQIESSKDELGATHVTYEQVYKGVPVFGGEIKAHLDAAGNLTAVNGVAVPDIAVNTSAKLSAADAAARAIAEVVADPPTDEETGGKLALNASDLRAASTKLYVYRMGLVRGVTGKSQLVYEVEVTNGSSVRDFVYVQAHFGKIVNRYSATLDVLHRILYESSPATAPIWEEGDPFPGSLNGDQQNLVNFSGHTYNLFFNAFGRDSYDGLGAFMRTVNNDPTIACPNANWNGITTNYCNGVTGDDTVGHEWGHAYTQFTHDLIYQWQPGALNESYSDIWGEVVDLVNGVGTDAPGPTRSVGSCSSFITRLPAIVRINSPAAIATDCVAQPAAFGPPLTAAGTTGDVVLANDGVGPNTADACTALPAGSLTGKIGLVDRGACTFVVKVKNAQNAGAIGAIVANNAPTGLPGMGGGDPTITIPSAGISQAHGNLIKGQLAASATVNVTMRPDPAKNAQDSYRWLSGEDDPAFGEAIRDMWDPTCISDPGKVSDAEYTCGTGDQGGVHTNSGVPNHGFALLVDGGTYNGQTVTALGLTKAAHLYWRAQSVYQTKTTDFADHADALGASCTDLIGQPLNNLSTGAAAGVSGQTISAADCSSVTAMIAAVELRLDPTAQCNFTSLLAQGGPRACGPNSESDTLFSEKFEKQGGPKGWTLSNSAVFPGAAIVDWAFRGDLPGGRSGSAAFAEDLDGQCDGGANDRSGVMRLQSPSIRISQDDDIGALRLTFQHYVATELGWDGGNVKLSINGGPFAIIPAAAYLFNPYNLTMFTAGQGNTSPLAGQAGFSGTDGGQVTGSWGESLVDLGTAGVNPGDTIRLSFEFGMDGCGAIDGWYVDDVKIRACEQDDDDDDDGDDLNIPYTRA